MKGGMPFCIWQSDPLLPGGLSVRERTRGRTVGWMCDQCRSGRCPFRKSISDRIGADGGRRKSSRHWCGGRKRMFSALPGCDYLRRWIYSRVPGNQERKQPTWNDTESSAKCRTFGKRYSTAAHRHIASDHKCCRLDTIGDCCTDIPTSAVATDPSWKDRASGGWIRSASDGSTGTAETFGCVASLAGSQPMVGYEFLDGPGKPCSAKPAGIYLIDRYDSRSSARYPDPYVQRLPAGIVVRDTAPGADKAHWKSLSSSIKG